ncbi:MAG TPA: glycosyltransferase family 2 protein [Planctomycetaceae bacterium]|nr:glycosyltransferase family 2 protein [Planctomycetaceae bacterium]
MTTKFLTALPVYNEQSHVAEVLERVRRFSPEILVINDGSKDDTAGELARFPDVHVVTHDVNQGYGAALRSAFNYALSNDFDVLVTIDCDGQHEPALIPPLVAALTDNVDLVSGSRYLARHSGDSVPPADRRHINFVITELLNQQLGLMLTDAFCGFKAYHARALRQFDITEPGYAMPLQLWVQAAAARLRIVEFPVPLIYLEEERSFGGALDDAKFRLAHYREVLDRELKRLGPIAVPRERRPDCCPSS